MARLILADDHPIVLDGLRRLFEAEPRWSIVATCPNGEDTLSALRHHGADLLILDLQMPGITGLDVLRCIRDEKISVLTMVLTAGLHNEAIVDAIQLGARGVVLKDQAPSCLLDCADVVLSGDRYIEPEIVAPLIRRSLVIKNVEVAAELTLREIQVVESAARGMRNRDIAAELRITEGTVKVHLHNAYQKLGVTNRVELTNRIRRTYV